MARVLITHKESRSTYDELFYSARIQKLWCFSISLWSMEPFVLGLWKVHYVHSCGLTLDSVWETLYCCHPCWEHFCFSHTHTVNTYAHSHAHIHINNVPPNELQADLEAKDLYPTNVWLGAQWQASQHKRQGHTHTHIQPFCLEIACLLSFLIYITIVQR